jgi:hypothetical protein
MEEIKIWKLDGTNHKPKAVPVAGISQTATEQLLEDVLTTSPDLLMPNLRLIGRQTETAGGPLDLLGVDEDGRLVVFELKRGTLTRDAVAQAIDYASFLADLEPEELFRHISEQSGRGGTESISDFTQWYQTHFQRSALEIGSPRVVLVGLGVDERARRMVAYLAESELDISLITFHGFNQNGETLLARQVEVKPRPSGPTVKSTKQENQRRLDQLLVGLGMKNQYEALVHALKSGLSDSAYQWPNPTGYCFYFPEISESGGTSNRSYVTVNAPDKQTGRIQIYLYPRAIEAVGKQNIEKIATDMGSNLVIKPSGYGEFWIDGRKDALEYAQSLPSLGEILVAAWKTKMATQVKEDTEEET